MKKYFANGYRDIYKSLILMNLVAVTDILNTLLNLNFPLLRYFFAMAGVYYFLKGIYHTHRNSKLSRPSIKILFYVLVLATFVMIARGLPVIMEGKDHYMNLKLFISGQIFIYLFPLIYFSEPDPYLLKKIFKLSLSLSIIYLIITIPLFVYFLKDYYNGAEFLGIVLAASSSILLLTQSYHSVRIRWISVITFLIVLFINISFARRNQVAYFSSILFFVLLIHLFSKSYFAKKKKAAFTIGVLLTSIFIFSYIYVASNTFIYLYEKTQTGMESRQYVIEKFYSDFDSHPIDYVYGRGINGTISGNFWGNNGAIGERSAIENGYLQHILVGGWIYLGLILIISIRAIYLGFFKSHNILTKAFAAIVITYLIDMIGFGIPLLTLKHFMIWMGISVCYSAKMRSYTDEYLKSVVGLK